MSYELSDEELRKLIPQTDAGVALSRMVRGDRLPRYAHSEPPKASSAPSKELVEFIESIGLPKA